MRAAPSRALDRDSAGVGEVWGDESGERSLLQNGGFAEEAHEDEGAPEEECDKQDCAALEACGAAVLAALLVGEHADARDAVDAF